MQSLQANKDLLEACNNGQNLQFKLILQFFKL